MDVSGVVPDLQASRKKVNGASAPKLPWAPAVVHVSPTYFSNESIIGGGERYAEELSRAMSERLPVRFVSFGRQEARERIGANYERVILKSWTRAKMTPFAPGLWSELHGARAVHCYQMNTLPTFLAAIISSLRGVPVFVSDLGGGGWTPGYHVELGRWMKGHLSISRYAARGIPKGHRDAGVIFGGVDLAKYPARQALEHDGSVLFLGRILPHKGIHFLIEGAPPEVQVHVIGPVVDPVYGEKLVRLAQGKQVRFHADLTDSEVRSFLRRAMVLVHPTPVDAQGSAGVNELFGLALVEAMACGCPVIASNVASLPEIVRHEEEGLLVPPNDRVAIRAAIERLVSDPVLWRRLAAAARVRVETQFTWDLVVDRCLHAYEFPPDKP